MKRFTLVCFAVFLIGIFQSQAQNLRAELALSKFSSVEEGPYLETYLRLKGESLKLTSTEGGFRATVLITYSISKAGSEIYKDSYKLNGPLTAEGMLSSDFIDLQRIPVKNGKHEVVMSIKDANNPEGTEAEITHEVVLKTKLLESSYLTFNWLILTLKQNKKTSLVKLGMILSLTQPIFIQRQQTK